MIRSTNMCWNGQGNYGILNIWNPILVVANWNPDKLCTWKEIVCTKRLPIYTSVSFVTEGYRYLTSKTKETRRCRLLRLACLWDMWVCCWGLGTLQKGWFKLLLLFMLYYNIYIDTLWSTQWMMMGEWIVGMFFYHGIPYYEMLFCTFHAWNLCEIVKVINHCVHWKDWN
jgi:hypothetical protein